MRFTITGATGFVGQALVSKLLAGGHSITVLGRSRKADLPAGVNWAEWQPESGEPPRESLENADVVVNLAGEPVAQRWTAEVKRKIRDSRVLGTRNLVRGMSKAAPAPKLLISASAVGFYGDRGEEVLTESSAPGTGFLPEVCVKWEKEASAAESAGTRVVIVRIGLALGPGGGALKQMLPPFRAGIGGKLGDGKQWMPWIHVHDLVGLMLAAAENPEWRGPVNGCAPNPVRNEDFTKVLAGVLHRPAVFAAPKFMLKLAMGEMAEPVLVSQRVQPKAALDRRFRFDYPDLKRALDAVLR